MWKHIGLESRVQSNIHKRKSRGGSILTSYEKKVRLTSYNRENISESKQYCVGNGGEWWQGHFNIRVSVKLSTMPLKPFTLWSPEALVSHWRNQVCLFGYGFSISVRKEPMSWIQKRNVGCGRIIYCYFCSKE